MEYVGASCDTSSTAEDIRGIYTPIGSKNGRTLYKNDNLGSNGDTWYFTFDNLQGEWNFESSQNPWPTIEDFNSESLGEIMCFHLETINYFLRLWTINRHSCNASRLMHFRIQW